MDSRKYQRELNVIIVVKLVFIINDDFFRECNFDVFPHAFRVEKGKISFKCIP